MVVITAAILALFFLRRRSKQKKRRSKHSVDLLNGYEDDDDDHPQNPQQLPHHLDEYYTPEPFMVPDTSTVPDNTTVDEHGVVVGGSSSGRPMSGTSQTYSRSGTPDVHAAAGGYGWAAGSTATSSSRKGALPRMRPINIVQHEDAGPPPPAPADGNKEEPETIELPPAYTAVRGVGANVTPPAEDAQPAAAPGTPRT